MRSDRRTATYWAKSYLLLLFIIIVKAGIVPTVDGSIAQRLVHGAIAVSTAVLGQSHKDNVRCTAVEEQLEAKEVQLSQPSSTCLLMISSGLT